MIATFISLQLFVYSNIIVLIMAKGKIIDIFNNGNEDILQLRRTNRYGYHYGGDIFRNAIFSNSDRKWTIKDSYGNTVLPYVITGRYDNYEISTIKKAMTRIEANTCIRFRRRTSERDYIDIQNRRGEGCYTSVGRLNGRSVLMLESNEESTCMETHIVQHELLHAIGLWHEHMRFDRDRYIRVHYENIRPGFESQFNRIPSSQSTTYNLPYDYKSVMHYGKTAFALPGRISMETFDRKYTNVIGQQHDASPSDYLKVCKIYGCNRCNGGSVTPGGTDEEPDPWNPKPKPVSPDDGKCMDKIPQLCAALHLSNVLNCNGNGKNYCCATCKRRGGDSSGSSYDDDYYDSY